MNSKVIYDLLKINQNKIFLQSKIFNKLSFSLLYNSNSSCSNFWKIYKNKIAISNFDSLKHFFPKNHKIRERNIFQYRKSKYFILYESIFLQ